MISSPTSGHAPSKGFLFTSICGVLVLTLGSLSWFLPLPLSFRGFSPPCCMRALAQATLLSPHPMHIGMSKAPFGVTAMGRSPSLSPYQVQRTRPGSRVLPREAPTDPSLEALLGPWALGAASAVYVAAFLSARRRKLGPRVSPSLAECTGDRCLWTASLPLSRSFFPFPFISPF